MKPLRRLVQFSSHLRPSPEVGFVLFIIGILAAVMGFFGLACWLGG